MVITLLNDDYQYFIRF